MASAGTIQSIGCFACEKRNSTLPLVVTILAENGFIGVKEVGRLAQLSPKQRTAIFDSDKDVWLSLFWRRWQSTEMMPVEVLRGMSSCMWCERLSQSKCPGLYDCFEFTKVQEEREEIKNPGFAWSELSPTSRRWEIAPDTRAIDESM